MDIAGDLVQDFCAYLQIPHSNSIADFPQDFTQLGVILSQVESLNAARLKMTAEMADSSQNIKMLVVQAEDFRMLGDMPLMSGKYAELDSLNKRLLQDYKMRSDNHGSLSMALKEVNMMIQKAAKLRVGDVKTKFITECRNAIRSNNTKALYKLMQYGLQHD